MKLPLTDTLFNILRNKDITVESKLNSLENADFGESIDYFDIYKTWLNNIKLQPSKLYASKLDEVKNKFKQDFNLSGKKEDILKDIFKDKSQYSGQINAIGLYIGLKEQQLMKLHQNKVNAAVEKYSK